MPRWHLSLPLPAAPTSPSRLRCSSLPISVDLPSRRPLMLSCSRAVHRHPSPSITVHHHQIAIAPSLSVHHHCDCSPLLSRSRCPSPYIAIKEPSCHPLPSRSRHAVHCHRAAPSITAEEPSITVNLSTTFKSPSLRPLLSIAVKSPSCRPSSSHRTIHHRQVAIVPSFAVHCRCNHSPSALRSRHPSLPSPPISRRAFHYRQVATAPSIAVHRCPSPL